MYTHTHASANHTTTATVNYTLYWPSSNVTECKSLLISANSLLGSLMYTWYVWLFQHQNVSITSTGIPFAAAVVAAPMRKLCPA